MAILDNIKVAWKLDESSGDATDSSGGGFTLSNTGVTYEAGKLNNCAVLADTGDILRSTTLASWNPTNFTINFWIYRATDATTGLGSIATWQLNDLQIGVVGSSDATNKNKIRIDSYNGSGTDTFYSTSTIPNNTWTMVTVDHDSGVFHIYFNNDSADLTSSSATTTWEASGNNFTLGNQANGTNQWLGGKIDSFTGWDRVLTSGERTTLWNSGNGIQYPFASSVNMLSLLNVG